MTTQGIQEPRDKDPEPPKAGMLGKRLQTAGILIAVFVLFFLLAPPWLLCARAILVVLLGYWEYFEMTEAEANPSDRLLCLTLVAFFPLTAYLGKAPCLYGYLFACFMVLSFHSLFSKKELETSWAALQRRMFGILYVGFTLSHFLLFADLENWRKWIFAILIVIYMGDGAAYFAGSYLGKRKLAERLSPKKTWEGALGGLLGSLAGILICKLIFFSCLSYGQSLILAAALAVSGQMGDLVESLIKRSHNTKDSGNLLPGHGGILDRIDSVLFAVPVGYYLALLL